MPITVKRRSDNKIYTLPNANENTKVADIKKELHANFKPQFEHGCRLYYFSKVLKSIHRLKHYAIPANAELDMDDSKNWQSSSSSSESDRD